MRLEKYWQAYYTVKLRKDHTPLDFASFISEYKELIEMFDVLFNDEINVESEREQELLDEIDELEEQIEDLEVEIEDYQHGIHEELNELQARISNKNSLLTKVLEKIEEDPYVTIAIEELIKDAIEI